MLAALIYRTQFQSWRPKRKQRLLKACNWVMFLILTCPMGNSSVWDIDLMLGHAMLNFSRSTLYIYLTLPFCSVYSDSFSILFCPALQIHTAEWHRINVISLMWDTWKNCKPGLQFFYSAVIPPYVFVVFYISGLLHKVLRNFTR